MVIVHKYGGSSVSTTEKMMAIAKHLHACHESGEELVVVVSAMGGTTNKLIALSNEITDTPNKRELDVLLSTGELQSVALLSIALHKLGERAVSLSGGQAGF